MVYFFVSCEVDQQNSPSSASVKPILIVAHQSKRRALLRTLLRNCSCPFFACNSVRMFLLQANFMFAGKPQCHFLCMFKQSLRVVTVVSCLTSFTLYAVIVNNDVFLKKNNLPVPSSARPAHSLCPASCLPLQPRRDTRPCGEEPCTRCVPLAHGGRQSWGSCRRSPAVG